MTRIFMKYHLSSIRFLGSGCWLYNHLGVAIAQSEVSNYGDGLTGRQTLLGHDGLVHGADFCDRHRGRPSDDPSAPPADPLLL